MKYLNAFSLSAGSDTSFWEDIWNYIYDVYFRVDGNYQNLGLEKMPLFSIRLALLGIFIGCVIACIIMLYNKQIIGNIVRKLISSGSLSPENAKKVDELGLLKNPLAKNALLSDTALRRLVRCVEEDEFYSEQNKTEQASEETEQTDNEPKAVETDDPETPKENENGRESREHATRKSVKYLIDLDTAHFYIPEELRIRAELKYEKKGSGIGSTIISIIVLAAIFFAVLLVLPMILDFIDGLL